MTPIPPGQYYGRGLPSCRPGRRCARRWEERTFSIRGAGDEARLCTWASFTALCHELQQARREMKGARRSPTGDRVRGRRLHDDMGLEDFTDGPAWIAYDTTVLRWTPKHGGFGL